MATQCQSNSLRKNTQSNQTDCLECRVQRHCTQVVQSIDSFDRKVISRWRHFRKYEGELLYNIHSKLAQRVPISLAKDRSSIVKILWAFPWRSTHISNQRMRGGTCACLWVRVSSWSLKILLVLAQFAFHFSRIHEMPSSNSNIIGESRASRRFEKNHPKLKLEPKTKIFSCNSSFFDL